MTRTLLLWRHAKSSWEEDLDDAERPLAPRGRRAAAAMAAFMRREGWVPERVLCSAAVRTRGTWAIAAPVLGRGIPVEFRDELYLAGPERMLAVLRELPDTCATAMLVGHNPGTEDLARRLAGAADDDARAHLRPKFPTAALAVLTFEVSWAEIEAGAGTLRRFVRPRDAGVV